MDNGGRQWPFVARPSSTFSSSEQRTSWDHRNQHPARADDTCVCRSRRSFPDSGVICAHSGSITFRGRLDSESSVTSGLDRNGGRVWTRRPGRGRARVSLWKSRLLGSVRFKLGGRALLRRVNLTPSEKQKWLAPSRAQCSVRRFPKPKR